MPNRPSAKKHLKQTKTRTKQNNKFKRLYKEAISEAEEAIEQGLDAEKIKERFSYAQKRIDKAAKKGVIHGNKASRLVGQLQSKVQNYLNN